MSRTRRQGSLKRVLGFWAIVAFGVGDILGAGIYALVGKIAGVAGSAAWMAFGVSLGVAALTAFSYAELSSRLPRSGGEATFTQDAFRVAWLPILIGWMVLCSGMVSMATVSKAFVGYLQSLGPDLPSVLVVILFIVGLTGLTFWGMRQSSAANLACTAVELAGLLFVIGAGVWFLSRGGAASEPSPAASAIAWPAILQGGALAFFAFIGFEDMVNVAEEVRAPERAMPVAILTALAVAGLLYMLVSVVAVLVVPPAELAASSAPLLEVVRRAAPALRPEVFVVVALFAVSNTALLNCVMGSRLLYGMATQGLLPKGLSAIHPTRHTPHVAIAVIGVATIALALSGTLTVLASTTSALLLGVFCVVNISLVVIKRRSPRKSGLFRVPLAIPLLGACASLGLLMFVQPQALARALVVVALGVVLIVIRHLTRRRSRA